MFESIINNRGYSYDNLTEKQKAAIDFYDYAIQDAGNKEFIIEDMLELMGDESILGKIKAEIASETIDKVLTYLTMQKQALIVSFIDDAPEADSEEKTPDIKCIGYMDPIDHWCETQTANNSDTEAVLALMPEAPRDKTVYVTYIPDPYCAEIKSLYMCKADNNGTVYLFAEDDSLTKVLPCIYSLT